MFLSKFKGNSLARSGVKYSIASTLSSVATMVVGFVNMRWLGPELLGIWQSLTIINSYLPFLQLGIQSGLNLELPIVLGRGERDNAMKMVATAKRFAVFLSFFLLIAGSVAVITLVCLDKEIKIVAGAIAITILSVISCFRLHYIATYRSASAFDVLSKIYIVDAIVALILLLVIRKYLYFGLLIYYVTKELIVTILMWYFAPYRKEPGEPSKNVFGLLLKRGAFMMAINQIKGVIDSFPKLLLLSLGGTLQVGLFSPALTVGSFINLVPNQIAQFLQPQMGYKYGQTRKAKDMYRYIRTLTWLVPIVLTPIAAVGWLLIPYVLEYIFPKYLSSLWPVRIMLIGFLFSTSYLTRNFIITLKAYKQVGVLYIIDVFCFLVIPWMICKASNLEITIALSIGLSVGYFLSYILNYFIVKHTLFLPKYNN